MRQPAKLFKLGSTPRRPSNSPVGTGCAINPDKIVGQVRFLDRGPCRLSIMGTKIRLTEATFACYSKVCAPPPAGRGGSSSSGKTTISYAEATVNTVSGLRALRSKEAAQRAEARTVQARKKRRAGGERWNKEEITDMINAIIRRNKA